MKAEACAVLVVLIAAMYATSAGVEQTGSSRPRGPVANTNDAPSGSSAETWYLPGTIPISRLRQMQDLERAPRRAGALASLHGPGSLASTFGDQRMRWIEPYWKGPNLAAVVERAYKLKP